MRGTKAAWNTAVKINRLVGESAFRLILARAKAIAKERDARRIGKNHLMIALAEFSQELAKNVTE